MTCSRSPTWRRHWVACWPRGVGDLSGLDELRERLAKAREELLSRFQLGDILADVRRELDEVVATELHGIERRMANSNDLAADIAAKRQRQLNNLPADVAGKIRALEDYDFLEPEAREHFNEIVERLRRQVLDSYFSGMSDALKSVSPDDLARNREMVRELNQLLQDRLEGREPDVRLLPCRVTATFFPGAKTLDDIIEQLAARMAAMQSLLSS